MKIHKMKIHKKAGPPIAEYNLASTKDRDEFAHAIGGMLRLSYPGADIKVNVDEGSYAKPPTIRIDMGGKIFRLTVTRSMD